MFMIGIYAFNKSAEAQNYVCVLTLYNFASHHLIFLSGFFLYWLTNLRVSIGSFIFFFFLSSSLSIFYLICFNFFLLGDPRAATRSPTPGKPADEPALSKRESLFYYHNVVSSHRIQSHSFTRHNALIPQIWWAPLRSVKKKSSSQKHNVLLSEP